MIPGDPDLSHFDLDDNEGTFACIVAKRSVESGDKDSTMAIRCTKCGVESPLEGAFHRLQITRRISRWYCPLCMHERNTTSSLALLTAGTLALPVGLVLHYVDGHAKQYPTFRDFLPEFPRNFRRPRWLGGGRQLAEIVAA